MEKRRRREVVQMIEKGEERQEGSF